MQRLRRIKQMGFAWLVYPGAEHSRFGHALGAFHIAQRLTRRLELAAERSRATSRSRRCSTTSATARSRTRGSTCSTATITSGGARGSRPRIPSCAPRSRRSSPACPTTLRRVLGQRLPAALRAQAGVVAARRRSPRLPAARRPLLRRRLRDVRPRLDHPRDPGRERCAPATRSDDLVVDYRRGMYAVEQYLFARSYMYAQVYHHKTVRAAEHMFIKTLERFAELARAGAEPAGLAIAAAMARGERDRRRRLSPAARRLGDDRARSLGGRRRRAAEDPVLRDLADRLVDRRLFKTFDLGDDTRRRRAPVAPQALAVAERRFGERGALLRPPRHRALTSATSRRPTRSSTSSIIRATAPSTLSRLLEDMPLGQPTPAIRLVCAPELVDELRPRRARARPWPRPAVATLN